MTGQTIEHAAFGTTDLTAIVGLACRAPSLHNSQPWRCGYEAGTLRLFADHGRVGLHTDSTGREVILSCGAILDHLQVAAAFYRWHSLVDRCPDQRDQDYLASISFHRADAVTEHERALGEAILARRTDRLAFAAPEPWVELHRLLDTVVDGTGISLDIIDDSGRPALADVSRRTEHHRRADASYRYELLWWAGHSRVDDGLPTEALPSTAEASHVDIARDFPTYGVGDRRPQADSDHSKFLVLSSFDDSRENTLRCGEVLSRVLLECTAAGFATCPLTHMIEVHDSREMLRGITGRNAEPQVLVRVGLALETNPVPGRTPRRAVNDILHVR
ncbi:MULTISPECIES: Acg family FMN-binding oxidoreductase [unclassified Mycolicibacterium]|uniref:Acg family FMN-binding oxidoreductase n=1 Tax=unclassified Mycolicibacterium TaxID=2636767 RepID=UPI002ED93D6D